MSDKIGKIYVHKQTEGLDEINRRKRLKGGAEEEREIITTNTTIICSLEIVSCTRARAFVVRYFCNQNKPIER